MKAIQTRIEALGSAGMSATPNEYAATATGVAALSGVADVSRTFCVDLVKPLLSGSLNAKVAGEIIQAVELPADCGAVPAGTPRNLDTFRRAFARRYETAWAPLLEVLDPEIGIGLAEDLADISADAPQTPARDARKDPSRRLSDFHAVLLSKTLECAGARGKEIVLERSDFVGRTEDASILPDSLSLTVTLIAASDQALESGDVQLLLHSGVGPSGATLLARWCHASPDLERAIRRHLREEESLAPDAIFAELRIDDHTVERRTNHDDGKEYTTDRLVISPDGKELTMMPGLRSDGTPSAVITFVKQ